MIKLVPIILLMCFCSATGQLLPGGQVEDFEKKKDKDGRSAAFMSISLRSSEIAKAWPLDLGGNIEFINNSNIALGIAMYTKVTTDVKLDSPSFPGDSPFLMYSYGGFSIGYYVPVNDYLHLNISTLFGLGILSYNYSASVVAANIVDRDWFYMAEPGASLGIKIYGRYYLNLNAAFRLSADADFYNITNSELAGPVLGGGVRIRLY